MRRTSSRSLAATSLLALLTALAVPTRAEAEERANHATSVRMVRDAEHDVVRIVVGFSETPTFTARLDRNGLRLVVDVPNADLKGAPTALTERQGVVGGVMAQAFQTDGKSTTRLLVTLLEQAKYSVVVDGTDLVIALSKDAANLGRQSQGHEDDRRAARHGAGQGRSLRAHGRRRSRADRMQRRPRVSPDDERTRKEHAHVVRRATRQGALTHARCLRVRRRADLGLELRPREGRKDGGDSERGRQDGRRSRHAPRQYLDLVVRQARRLPSSMTGVGLDGGIARRARTVHVENQAEDSIPFVRDGSESDALLAKSDGDREVASEPAEAGAFAPNLLGQTKRSIYRSAHRSRSQGRRHPQRPAPARRRRAREHRHRRRRVRHGHDPHAQRALGSGARRRAAGQGPRHGAARQHDPRRAARRAREGARAADRAPPARSEARAARDAPHPGQLRASPELQDRAQAACSRRAARSPSTSARTCSSCATSPATSTRSRS